MNRAIDLRERAAEAYVYFYPLVVMELTRRQLCANALRSGRDLCADPMIRNPNIANAKWRSVARTNIDTLFSSCWLDIEDGPAEMHIPTGGSRFFMYQVLDMWSDTFAVLGSRTLGERDVTVRFVPRQFDSRYESQNGNDRSVVEIPTPTRFSWIIGRTFASTDEEDLRLARRHQAGVTVTHEPAPSKLHDVASSDVGVAPIALVDRMTTGEFFEIADRLWRREGAHTTDWSQLLRLGPLGFSLERPFVFSGQSHEVQRTLDEGVQLGAEMSRNRSSIHSRIGQWEQFQTSIGVYGNDYRRRAIVARYGLAANPPEDAVYISTHEDERGGPLKCGERYSIHFPAGGLPPARYFWSITAYDPDGQFMDNKWNRYGLRSKDDLQFETDGSLRIVTGPTPSESMAESNWIPTVGARFTLTLRMYGPNDDVLSGRWHPPAVRRIGGADT